jgi:hypothetical protein
VARIRPETQQLPELVVRVTGGIPLVNGSRVGLSVQGTVVAWPIDEATHRHDEDSGDPWHHHHRQDVTEN